MPVQQQMSSFARKLGARVAQANAECQGKPIDTGIRRLPPGIRSGTAKLSAIYTKEQTEDGGMVPKGETFLRASAIVLTPDSHNGEKVAGMVTQVLIPLCDVPAKGQRKAKTFNENYKAMRDLILSLGVAECPETPQTDPTGSRTEAYWFAAMRGLTDPQRARTDPVIVEFSTRGWTPDKPPGWKEGDPLPEEMVFEKWHGRADPSRGNGRPPHDPAAGVRDGLPPTPPATYAAPAVQQTTSAQPPVQPTQQVVNDPHRPSTDSHVTQAGLDQLTAAANQTSLQDPADAVAALVEVAMGDPEERTEDGAQAVQQLIEMAKAAGWSAEEVAHPPSPFTDDWAGVGDMALSPPPRPVVPNAPEAPKVSAPTAQPGGSPAVGSRWAFRKRGRDGTPLKNNKGDPLPAQECEVVAVDLAARTCTLSSKDGKPVSDIRTKQPVAVKWEWLEAVAY